MTKHTFDTNIRPQDDFFGYVNNPWLAANPIPETESSWGTFYELRDQATDAAHAIMDDLAGRPANALTHDQQLLRSFYRSALHYDEQKQAHYGTLRALYADIDAIQSSDDLAYFIGQMHSHDQTAFWTVYVDHDDKDSKMQVLRFHQSGLTLPNRDYYLSRTTHMRDIRTAYQTFHTDLSAHLGDLVPAQWDSLYSVEHRLAKAAWTNVKLRDIAKNYNRMSYARLKQKLPFAWDAYSRGLGWTPSDHIVVSQPSFMREVLQLLNDTPLEDIKSYLKWRVLLSVVMWIDAESTRIAFALFATAISGVRGMKPLWKRAIQAADGLIIGEAVGREYAARHFPESSKQAVLAMVEDIRSAYHTRLDHVSWMGDATKAKAHRKLDAMKVLIGYPNTWKDLSDLSCPTDNHIASILAARQFWNAIEIAKVGTPPLAEQWEMNAHTVNAYHHPNRLEIVFPAAILQPPFFDPSASYATNLGGIGAVIGHEFTHGFDDQGADFDEHGNTNRWQTPEERAEFDTLAQHIVKQADAYQTVPGVFLQGKLILGEAIADVGGLELALQALRDHTSAADFRDEVQGLFVNFARCECGHATRERLIELAKIDPHPPSPFRVNCVVCHTSTFYEAYDVKTTDGLYLSPNSRAHIW
jgi:predicted metalloendopeptidase